MAKIDLEKVLIALLDSPFNKQFDDKVKDALNEQGLEYKDGEIVEIQKPKFKVGDWIVSSWGSFWRIKEIDQFYLLEGIDGREAQRTIYWVNNTFHNWTIQDAKDGDVLACGDKVTDYPFIFHNLTEQLNPRSYCGVNTLRHFQDNDENGGSWCNSDGVRPATKEQRDLLFQKMKEAGYEWDSDKKELKKVDKTKDLSNYIKFLKSFHCWSKEQREIMDKYLEEQIKKNYSPEEDKELFFGDFRKTDSEDKGKASFANRQVYNRAILKILSDYIEKYPDMRFVEMLCNLGFHLDYMEESQITYLDLNKIINKQKS